MSRKTETKQGQKRRGKMKGDKKTNRKKRKGNKTLSHKKGERGQIKSKNSDQKAIKRSISFI
jgi:hypothetical protein